MKANKEIKDSLEAARIDLLLNYPFYGMLAYRMPIIEVKSIPTLATDYKRIFYNPDYVKTLTPGQLVFALAHELGHCTHGHLLRVEERNPKLWNIAGDFEINYDLSHERITRSDGSSYVGVGSRHPSWLYDDRFASKPAEEIYDILENENNWQQMATQDHHLSPSDLAGDTDGDNEDILGEEVDSLPEIPPMSKEEQEQARSEFVQAVFDVASSIPGSISGKIQRRINELRNPRKDWRSIIRSTIESAYKPNKTWINPHRRSWSQGYVTPGPAPEKAIDIAIAIDTSGSVSREMLTCFLSEVHGMMKQFRTFKIQVWSFDHRVYHNSYLEFTESNGVTVEDFDPIGGGGTNFGANWEYMKKNKIRPDRFIMFTDGYCSFDGCDADLVDTVWVIYDNNHFSAPFGTSAFFNMRESK
jgi:predicted metal-dependent peptidase